MDIKKLVADGATQEQIMNEVTKQYAEAQAEIQEQKKRTEGLDNARTRMLTAIIEYLVDLGAIKDAPSAEKYDELIKTIKESEPVLKANLPNLKVVTKFQHDFKDPFEHLWNWAWPW